MLFFRDYSSIIKNVRFDEYKGHWKEKYKNFSTLVVFGDNDFGELGLGDNENRNIPTQTPNLKAKQISAGTAHTVLIDLKDDVWSFGSNEYGQLGLGDNYNTNIPTQIPNLKSKQMSAGWYHTMIIDLEDNLWGFGRNIAGQLGLGDYKNRNAPTQIPNIKAKQVSTGENFKPCIITFAQLQNALQTDEIAGYSIEPEYQTGLRNINIAVTLIDRNGNRYLVTGRLDERTGKIYPPL